VTAVPDVLSILSVHPARPYFRTGEDWTVSVTFESAADHDGELTVRALHPGRVTVGRTEQVRVNAGRTVSQVDLGSPVDGTGGRQLVATFRSASSGTATATGALDVLDDWRDDPRYGFLCDFAPGAGDAARRVSGMSRHHVNVVQLYDWAYRHHELMPPTPEYADVLGKPMSLATVREAIDAAHKLGMAALGYATVYAAEREFTELHPDWQLRDDQGNPWHLADLFFLMDLSGKTGWTEHMLGQLDHTLSELDLDGFHLDQYGYPRVARLASGELLDTAEGLVDFVTAANRLTAARRPSGGSIFNNVNGWPVDLMAPTAAVANYIEVWKPHTDYHDLVQLADRAHRLAPAKPVVLAAYPGFLREDAGPGQHAGGLALLAAVVLASGAWPLLVGEGENVLTAGYYPEFVAPDPQAALALRRVLDAGVAWRDLLRGGLARPVAEPFVDGQDREIEVDVPYSSRPLPGRVWVRIVEQPDWVVVSLVNLLGATTARWNRAQPEPQRTAVTVRLPQGVDASTCWVGGVGTQWQPADAVWTDEGVSVTVDLDLWSVVAVRPR
jgi:dextranase